MGRWAAPGGLGLVLGILFAATSAGAAGQAAQASIPFPSSGNVTVARLTITASGAGSATPRLALASRSGLPATAFVAATVGRIGAGRFQATVAVFNPVPATLPPRPTSPTVVAVRLPAGFALAGPPQVARDVLYTNPIPSFPIATGGVGSILAGANPPRLAPIQIVRDAQLFAFERSVPLADVGLLGVQYVAAQFSKSGSTTLQVTIGLYQSSQVNAIELRFPAGTRVTNASGPTDTNALLLGSATQLISSTGFYQDGVMYSFTLQLSKPPKRGDFVTVRASTHYFESSLPFTERFALL